MVTRQTAHRQTKVYYTNCTNRKIKQLYNYENYTGHPGTHMEELQMNKFMSGGAGVGGMGTGEARAVEYKWRWNGEWCKWRVRAGVQRRDMMRKQVTNQSKKMWTSCEVKKGERMINYR